jgi:NADH-quinone oxidoreductase subunit G
VLLPSTVWAECDGTFVNKQGRAQVSERALAPRGDAQPGWKLVAQLGRSLGFATEWKRLSEIRRAMAPEPTRAPSAPDAQEARP